MVGAMLPDGPLHPTDAVVGMIVGVAVAVVLGGHSKRGLVLAAAATAYAVRHQGLLDSFVDRSDPLLVVVAVIAIGALAGTIRSAMLISIGRLTLSALVATAGVWAIVPDTEAAVIGGGALAGSLIRRGSRHAKTADRASLYAVPLAAAVIGSIGRQARLSPALIWIAATVLVPALRTRSR